MFVSKKGMITIQPFSAMNEFYKAKQYYDTKKHKCMNCKKADTITITVENRRMTCKCSNCPLNISFFSGKYITYDALYELRKMHYMEAIEKDVDHIQYKIDYEELTTSHTEKLEQNKTLLQKYNNDKDEFIKVLRETKEVNNDELNDILNKIHALTYIKMGKETIRNNSFDIDIPILN
jgi:hypothetical protein